MSAVPPPHGLAAHEPLSEKLRAVLCRADPSAPLTLNAVLVGTEGRGVFCLIILLCFPFLGPVSIPGTSTPLGAVILILGLRLAFGQAQRLPRWVGERALPRGFGRVLNQSVKVLRFLEKWLVRPRRTGWLGWRLARCTNGLVLALMAFCLALPIPPVIPLTNMLPAYAIVLVAFGMMEEDGVMVWLGYAVAAGTLAYFAAWAEVIAGAFRKYYAPAVQWLQSWL
jgi:hypothetical protein